MRIFCYYDPKTGEFTGERFSAKTPAAIALNVHADRPAIEGDFSRDTHRVDLSGSEPKAVPRDIPRELSAEELRHKTLAQIQALEASQARALREVLLSPGNGNLDRLQVIEDQIVALRKQLA